MHKNAVNIENTIWLDGSGPKGRGFESRHFDRKTSQDQRLRGFRYASLVSIKDFYNVQYNVHHNVPTMYKGYCPKVAKRLTKSRKMTLHGIDDRPQ